MTSNELKRRAKRLYMLNLEPSLTLAKDDLGNDTDLSETEKQYLCDYLDELHDRIFDLLNK